MPDKLDRRCNNLDGVPIKLGAETLTVPALNFRQLEKYSDILASFSKWGTQPNPYAEMPKVLPVIHAAVARNYPDYTMEELQDNVDMSNYRRIFEAVMGVSGITDELLKKGQDLLRGGAEPDAAKQRVM